jgi:copper chaperone CopZ
MPYIMRRFSPLWLLGLISFVVLAGTSASAASQDGTKVQVKEGHRVRLIYYLTGAETAKEADSVIAAVKALPTVTSATANLERGYLKVSFDSHELSYHQVAQAIAEAGSSSGKNYDPRVVISVPDYAKPEIAPKIQAIFDDPKLRPWVKIELIDAAKGLFFVHFLPLKVDPNQSGTQGFNGGYLTHPIHMAPPVGMALPFKYAAEDAPEIPTAKNAAGKKS